MHNGVGAQLNAKHTCDLLQSQLKPSAAVLVVGLAIFIKTTQKAAADAATGAMIVASGF